MQDASPARRSIAPAPDGPEASARTPPLSVEGDGSPGALLLLRGGDALTRAIPDRGELLIGRGPEADLRIDEPDVSRRHAKLVRQDGKTLLLDLGSRNGTWLNAERVVAPRLVRAGDVVAVAGTRMLLRPRPAGGDEESERVAAPPLEVGGRRIVAVAPPMRDLFALLARLALSDLPLLITGETGTGKEIAAQAAHEWSRRHERRMVALNCAALPESLVESELFGHERGAFSGAVTAKPGILEVANGGTVLLDEVGELSPAAQAKLLRVLETQRLMRVGDVRERAIDVRLVAATNRDLADEVARGRFRRDLYYRLSTALVELPPLRERRGEILPLARSFLQEASPRHRAMTFSEEVTALLLTYTWPGNLRELRNVMHYVAATTAEDVLRPRHLPDRLRAPAEAAASPAPAHGEADAMHRSDRRPRDLRPLEDEIRELERRRIVEALAASGGVQNRAAELLRMPLRTFVARIKEYGLAAGRRSAPL